MNARDIATKARENASHCEAKKHALRQTQDGIVVAFVLHPNDVPPALQLAPLGTRYLLALVEIGDDETPIDRKDGDANPRYEPSRAVHPGADDTSPASNNPSPAVSVRAKFSDKLYANQAGILCNDPKFWTFLRENHSSAYTVGSKESAVEWLYAYCDIQSRTEIRPGTIAEGRWNLLVSAYRAWELAPACGIVA